MPIKRVLITHTLRKGFLGKDLEHYLRNRLRTMFLAVPKLILAISGLIKFLNISNYKISRSYGIFCRKPDNIF